MPNWCVNKAEFYNEDTAKVDELAARLKNLTDEDGLFSFFVKNPAKEKEKTNASVKRRVKWRVEKS